MSEPAHKIVVKDLTKVFGSRPERALELLDAGKDKDAIQAETGLTVGVDRASFAVREGEVFVVMGLSGSGKSTLVRLLNRLIDPTAGEVLLDGRDVARMDRRALIEMRRRDMTMVFQSFALMPHLSVLDNAAFGLDVAGVDTATRYERAREALDTVGLSAYAASRPFELSGGQQQRVGLARALAVDPTVMLMDEAFSALDPLIRSEMQDELLRLQEAHARTIVFISHDLDEAMRIGDRIAIMEAGRVVQVAPPDEILANPADDYVRSFFRGVDVSRVLSAGDIAGQAKVAVLEDGACDVRDAAQRLAGDGAYGYVVDERRRFLGIVDAGSLEGADSLRAALIDAVDTAAPGDSLKTLFQPLAAHPWPVPVVDARGRFRGAVSRPVLLATLDRTGEG